MEDRGDLGSGLGQSSLVPRPDIKVAFLFLKKKFIIG